MIPDVHDDFNWLAERPISVAIPVTLFEFPRLDGGVSD
jgi:hypothetical protein